MSIEYHEPSTITQKTPLATTSPALATAAPAFADWQAEEASSCLSCCTAAYDKGATQEHCHLRSGDVVTLDGATGVVYKGRVPMVPAGRDDDYQTIIKVR